jgi:hypothetical protein
LREVTTGDAMRISSLGIDLRRTGRSIRWQCDVIGHLIRVCWLIHDKNDYLRGSRPDREKWVRDGM